MTTTQFTTDDYLKAIQRELGKRNTTYPKIIGKMLKAGAQLTEIEEKEAAMRRQDENLKVVASLIRAEEYGHDVAFQSAVSAGLSELIRELKERKRCYPRWVKLYRMMTKETADYELAVWESLTRWFAKEYLDLDELPTKRKKKS